MAEAENVRGGRISLRPGQAIANDVGRDIPGAPTLGEIVDMLAAEYPDCAWRCDPALRGVRISSVVIRDE